MTEPHRPGSGSWDPLPSVAEMEAQFASAIGREARPFFALAGLPTESARWAQYSVWGGEGERDEPGRAFVSLAIRYGDDARWAMVGTRFGQYPRDDGTDEHREAMILGDMASDLGLKAAESGDGEAETNRDGMWSRIRAAQAEAKRTVAASLVIDGSPTEARAARVADHRRTSFYVPVGGAVFLHTCRWDGPTELRRALDYRAITHETDQPEA